MTACAASLRVPESAIAAGHVLVAEDSADEVLGVAAVIPEGATADLDLLFVEPARLGQGAGAALFAAATRLAAGLGATRLTILADPHAADFYARQGARFLRNAPSDAIPGRLLPLYEYALVSEAPR
ncbi:MAG: GNAT family N-acetyltransferase [Reyranellaceae bacterium]